tara:strand:- start:4475 stop:5104 length:630 start_codon:yes stop_codon:yes gene_type:complete
VLVWDHFPNFKTLQEQFPQIRTVLWDMDGTILNTEGIHFKSIIELISPPKDHHVFKKFCHGKTDAEVLDQILSDNLSPALTLQEFLSKKEQAFRVLIQKAQINEIIAPQIRDLIQKLHIHNYQQAIVTSSERLTTQFLLDLVQIESHFDQIITREDTIENKPSAMPYRFAMEKLKTIPEQVLIFEDSSVGIKAAKASGAHLVKAMWYEN